MHPYQSAPERSFWSKAVSSGFDARALINSTGRLIRPGEAVASAGSCFAANLVPYLEQAGLSYLRTESRHPALAEIPPENLGYDKFSAAYGNIYTPRQLLQLLRRCHGVFKPSEDRWYTDKGCIDPFRPGLRYHALNDREFDLLSTQHLQAVRRVFERAAVFIFTLGLTEAWVSRRDGAVFPACPGTVAGTFDPERHSFINFSAADIRADLNAFIKELRAINPSVRVILTVSPVPLVATATDQHVVAASTYSKSVLRVAAEEVVLANSFVTYFPAYEIVTGSQAPDTYFEPDRRNVSKLAVDTVMTAFLAACGIQAQIRVDGSVQRSASADNPGLASNADAGQQLSAAIADAECEEAMADSEPRRPITP